ncbi:unnamed protein product [Rhizoctonia solani]|uniref:Uncharacterized protein n=1 Tax=Rhizoctonia solani TaxID=456999 RepID=A0A8H3GNW2_9AGAM|nr:unnamed protein product [Rhizoctonia solani]
MHSYQILLLVLYGLSICSIVLLLLTTHVYKVKWHPVVNVILWMSVPSAIAALLHYPLDGVLRERLPIIPGERPVGQQHTALAYFCAVDAILLYIFSAISSGLAVSFTLVRTSAYQASLVLMEHLPFQSLFAVVVKSKHPGISSSPRTWRSFRWLWDPSTTTLCVVPFIWSLPLIGVGIETIVRTSRGHIPSIYYSNTYCNIDDVTYQLISGIILGSPLIVAAALIFAIVGTLTHMAIKNRGRASQSVNVPLALRFSAIVVQIFITAILLLCEISLEDYQLRGVFDLHIYWTSVTPLFFFFIFGTQRDLMAIWKYWAYRLAGKQPRYTPRSSNEGQTLSNTSAPATVNINDPNFIHKLGEGAQDVYKGDRKVHSPSSSAGGRTSGSIADALGPLGMKHSTDPSDLSSHFDRDVEAAIPEAISERSHPAHTLESPKAPSSVLSPHQTQFYSAPSVLSSQGLVSSHGHSGTRGLLTSRGDLPPSEPPFIVVTDGFGAVFGAQVPPNEHSGLMGRPIMTRAERERWLATDERQQRPRAEFGRERRKSVGLPPPPRSPRQSNARPSSAGGATALESKPNQRRGAGLGSGTSQPWNWDSPFHFGPNTTVQGGRNQPSSEGSGSASRHDSDLGIEMEEKVKTPSNGSFERGHVRHESQEESLRTSWVSKNSRVSVASDRTFG